MKKLLLSLSLAVGCIFGSYAETETLTLTSGALSGLTETTNKTVTGDNNSSVKWTFNLTGGALSSWDSSAKRGQQFGTSKAPISALSITSDGLKDLNISKITVNTTSAKNGNATLSVKVGEVAFESNGKTAPQVAINTQASEELVFEGSASGEVALSYTVTASALYVYSITVEYTEGEAPVVKKQPKLAFPQHDYYVQVDKTSDFEAPEIINPFNVSPIKYSIDVDDEDVAIIDENDGTIVLGDKAADITVTASFEGNEEYEADEQTYVIHITEEEFHVVTFDFENNDYGMTRFSGSGASFNDPETKFGDEWIICTANDHTRLWWTGKEATENASGKSMRVYKDGKITIETPAQTTITNIAIFHYNENGDAEDVTDAEDHEHVSSIEGNKAVLAADWTSSYHRLSAVEVTYTAKPEVIEALENAFKAGQHENGDSHITVSINGVAQVSPSISFSSADTEETSVSLSHYYPHAAIYAKYEVTPSTPAVQGLYYDAAEGYSLHTEPIKLTGSGTLSYYSELNGHQSPVMTVAVTDSNTTSISEVESSKVNEIFDLQGRKVVKPAHGLYIVNGQKVRL